MCEKKSYSFLSDNSICFDLRKGESYAWYQTIVSYLYRLHKDYRFLRSFESKGEKLSYIKKIEVWKAFDSYINNMNKYLSLIIKLSMRLESRKDGRNIAVNDIEIKKIIKSKLGVYASNFLNYRNKFAAHHLGGESKSEDYFLAENFNIMNPISFCLKCKRLKAHFSLGSKEKSSLGSINLTQQHFITVTKLHEDIIGVINIDDYLDTINWGASYSGL